MDWMQKRVREWREKVGLTNKDAPSMNPMMDADEAKAFAVAEEECCEFLDSACEADYIHEQAKEAADAIFTIFGWACARGIDLEPVFAAVCESNDSKAGEKDDSGKVIKGKSYVPPDIESVLRAQGWEG